MSDTLLSALEKTKDLLQKNGAIPVQLESYWYGMPAIRPSKMQNHAMWLCGEAEKLYFAGDSPRALRYLKFIHGVVWTLGIAPLNELRAQTKSQ